MSKKFKSMPKLAAVMTPFPYCIDINATITEAEQLMKKHAVHHLVVTEDGDFSSLISQRHIASAQLIGHKSSPDEELLVGDLSAIRPLIADIHDPLDRVLGAMNASNINSVVALKDGELAGIFTASDACKLLQDILQADFRGKIPPPQLA